MLTWDKGARIFKKFTPIGSFRRFLGGQHSLLIPQSFRPFKLGNTHTPFPGKCRSFPFVRGRAEEDGTSTDDKVLTEVIGQGVRP